MDEETYRQFPDELVMREVRIHIKAKGRKVRTRTITIATTLLDADEYPKADLAELRTAMKADLAELRTETKADLQAAIAPLATKAEVRAEIKAEGEQTRRHFDVVAEGIRSDVRLIAEGLAALQVSTDARHADVMGVLIQHDRRLTRLENPPKRRSPS